jgi:uncharacterized protein (TIGR02996 family)
MPVPADLEQAFLDDIVAHPENPALWLILADWLEDRGDPRAELVRLTWQLQYEPEHVDFAQRQARVQALLAGGMVPVRPRRTLAGIEFAWVPPGSFLMGSPPDEEDREDDETLHPVSLLAGFWMGVYPITQAQWTAVMGDNPSEFARTGRARDKVKTIGDAELERFPVESVTWEAAQKFCDRVGQGVELPTEAQWEYACRAGTSTPFHFGSFPTGREANCMGKSGLAIEQEWEHLARPSVVGSYPPNAWGLHDLHGNVWEWCQDVSHPEEETGQASNRPSGEIMTRRVLRGGSWWSAAWSCRAACRSSREQSKRNSLSGFRVVVPFAA